MVIWETSNGITVICQMVNLNPTRPKAVAAEEMEYYL